MNATEAFPAKILESLAERHIGNLLHGQKVDKVNPEYVITDGRSRKKLWKELVKAGYATEEDLLTTKAYDEVVAEPFDLTTKYKFDEWADSKQGGKPYIPWDRLTIPQRKFCIESGFTLLYVDQYDEKTQAEFKLGDAMAARDAIGGWSRGFLAVRNQALVEMRNQEAKKHFREKCLSKGLNWFLEKIGFLAEEEKVPIREEKATAFFGGGPALPDNPAEWATTLPNVIQKTKERISKEHDQLALFERLQHHIASNGGWDAFMKKYEEAVDGYVEEMVAKGEV